MTEAHRTYGQQQSVESHAPYKKVFLALLAFTVLEYLFARVFKDAFAVLLSGLIVLAVAKAGLVGWYFMHLKFEGRWVFLMLIPAAFLATVLVVSLYPDIGTRDPDDPTLAAPAEMVPKDMPSPATLTPAP